MSERKQILIEDFNYRLPEERIAKYPLEKRDASRLLIYKPEQTITHSTFSDLVSALPQNSLLVFNNTKVLHARIKFRKATGASIEIFCLKPHQPANYELAMSQKNSCKWQCIVGNKRKWKNGKLTKRLSLQEQEVELSAEITEHLNESFIIEFTWKGAVPFSSILEASGQIPIPPYLNRNTEDVDSERYQTVFAQKKGSVAAPTASLHYTDTTFDALEKSGHATIELTLHVGAGTFQPVKTDDATQHQMHAEQIVIKKDFVQQLLHHKNAIVANGTTVMRSLESIFWLGQVLEHETIPDCIEQWVWKKFDTIISKQKALENILSFMQEKQQEQIEIDTQIMITPGYSFKIANVLVTNFHQPKSTLLLLVSAFVGSENWKNIYNYALQNDFRFLSYGDSSVLFANKQP